MPAAWDGLGHLPDHHLHERSFIQRDALSQEKPGLPVVNMDNASREVNGERAGEHATGLPCDRKPEYLSKILGFLPSEPV